MPLCWVIGDAAVDVISDGTSSEELPGGTGANIAVALSRLGAESALITKLGNDPYAALLTATLEQEDVDTSHVVLGYGHQTGLVRVSVAESGEREFTFMETPSADSHLASAEIPSFKKGDWLCVSCFMLSQPSSREATLFAIEQAKSAGARVCVDANMRIDRWDDPALMVPTTLEALKLADIAKMSDDELRLLTGENSIREGIEKIRFWPSELKIVTRAEKGAMLLTGQSEFSVEGYDVPVVDMTGAGDAFVAAFISRLMPLERWADEDLVAAIKFANACGALVVGKKGAMSALPDSKTANKFVNEKSRECRH